MRTALALLASAGLASVAGAQVTETSGTSPTVTSTLDFDAPFVPSGPISNTAAVFTGAGFESVSLVGTWTTSGDLYTATSNVVGQGLASSGGGTLTVGTTGDPLDGADAGAGFDIVLAGAATDFGVRFVDQVNMDYDVELFLGSVSLGVGNFNYAGGFPNPPVYWAAGTCFDRILITFPNGSGGVGIDDLAISEAAPVSQGSGSPACPANFLDFDNPTAPAGPISSTSSVFTNNGISSVELIGTFTSGGDTLTPTSNLSGQCLVADGGVLRVNDSGDPVDSPGAGAGFDIMLNQPATGFSALFVDQVNMDYDIELRSGGACVGFGSFNYAGSFPNPAHNWVGTVSFDQIRITFPNGTGGVGLDIFGFDGGGLGINYCGSPANSTGQPGIMGATGSNTAASNDVTLTAWQLPSGQFAYFITSLNAGFIANPGGSNGNLCIGSGSGRFVNLIGQVDGAGRYTAQINLNNIPTSPSSSVSAGDNWKFQCWHRDVGGTSNFTDGLAIQFN